MGVFSKVSGTGAAFPKRRVTNYDLEKVVDTDHNWIHERTGIIERRISDGTPAECNSALASQAALNALEAAQLNDGIVATDIDLILLATVTPDFVMPNTACIVQQNLGITKAAAVDISAACSGFVYGLSFADSLIRTGQFRNVLVIGSEVLSSILNWKDRNTCILFGDGAGAAVVTRSHESSSRILAHRLYSDGSLRDLLTIPSSGSYLPVSKETIEADLHKVQMKGKEIFKVAVKMLSDCLVETVESAGAKIADLDWLIPHQANLRILEAVAKRLDYPIERVIVNLDRFGNTSGATVPTAFDEAIRDGRIQRGHLVGLTAFGAGLTYGSSVLKY